MAEMSRLMHEGATAENVKGMSEAEMAALRDAVEDEMLGGHADAKALNEELQAKNSTLQSSLEKIKAEKLKIL